MQYTPNKYTLSNGISVILDPMPVVTVAVIIDLGFGAGVEPVGQYGVAHFMEHMLCRGTVNLPSSEAIVNHIGFHGGGRNAHTGYSLLCLTGQILAENLDVLLETQADMLQNSLFDDGHVDTERKVILDEYRRSEDSRVAEFRRFMHKKLFAGTRMEYGVLGIPTDIENLTTQQLKKFLVDNLSADNMSIVISGAIGDEQRLLDKLEDLFAWLPVNQVKKAKYNITPCLAHNNVDEQKNVKLSICFRDMLPSTMENRFQKVCVALFKSVLKRRLMTEIRDNAGLVYGISFGKIGEKDVQLHAINTETAVENLRRAVALVARTCYAILYNKPISDTELQREKMILRFQRANDLESVSRRCNLLLSFLQQYDALYDYFYEQDLDIKITVKDIEESVKDIFSQEISIFTQGPSFEADLKQIWYDNFK